MRSVLLLVLWTGGRLFADVVTLTDGRQLSGVVESGNTQELHIKTGDQSQSIDARQVQAIQFGVSSAAAPASTKATATGSRTLILKDGTRIAGKWWSIDAGQIHFLVDNQLRHYARSDVSAVTSGDEPLPATTATANPPAPPPATVSTPPKSPAPTPKPQAPTLRASPGVPPANPPAAAQGGVSQPDEIGAVYFYNGKNLTPLEHNQAVEHKRGSTAYWEIARERSRVRVEEASADAFIVRLPRGVNPASYSLFPLTVADGNRQTSAQPGRKGGLMTWPFEIQTNNESSYMTYAFIVKNLPVGEYSFSPSNSNDGYCFGVDPSPGQ